MACRLIAIDLDGTLLGADGKVSARNRDAVIAAREAGVAVIVATGRSYGETVPALSQLGHEGPVIVASGALLCDARGATLDRQLLPADIRDEAMRVVIDRGHRALVLKDRHAVGYDYLAVGPAELHHATKWWFRVHPVDVRHTEHPHHDEDVGHTLRVGAVGDEDALAPVAAELETRLGDRASMLHWTAVTSSEAIGARTTALEVFGPDVNKWTMLESHAAGLGIAPHEIAAIGDGANDVEMIAGAGLGIAMANASDDVRDAADEIVPSFREDGAAVGIEMAMRS